MTYFSISQGGFGEISEKRSKFLCWISSALSAEQARTHALSLKSEHLKARHVCWAWLGIDGAMRANDDGEPNGCAGKPMLSVLEKAKLINVACYCVRYFGGVLLGTGGLSRAYREAAECALKNAVIKEVYKVQLISVNIPYSHYEKIEHTIKQLGGFVMKVQYLEEISIQFALPPEKVPLFMNSCTALPCHLKGTTYLSPKE